MIYQQHSDGVKRIAWAPEGKRIASAGREQGIIRVWSSITGELLLMYRGHQRRLISAVCALCWSPDGQRIASSATTRAAVHVWDTTTGITTLTYRGHCLPMIGAPLALMNDLFALAWEPKGTRIASSSAQVLPFINSDIHIWDADTGKTLFVYHAHNDVVNIVMWSPDSIHVASADNAGTIHIWHSHTGDQLLVYRPQHKRKLVDKSVSALAWSPDGTKIVSTYYDCQDVYVWDAKTGDTLFIYSGHTAIVRGLTWAPDGSKIASGSYDKTVHIWDATTGKRFFIYRKHTGNIEALAWSPDGTSIASGGQDRIVHVWQAIEK